MNDIRFGFIGAGKIAHKLADAISHVEGAINYAVAARDINRALQFKELYGFTKAYGSYEEMLQDPNVDAVYISTIHSLHYEHALLALKYNKPVLCEKSLTTSLKDTIDLYKQFEDKKVLLLEALWTSFQPFNEILKNLIFNKKVIGDLKMIKGYFYMDGFPIERIRTRSMGGGAMLDIGIYPLSFIYRLLGCKYSSMKIAKCKIQNDVDSDVKIIFTYPGDIKGIVNTNANTKRTDNYAKIYGNNGVLLVNSTTYPTEIKVFNKYHKLIETIDCSNEFGGYTFEVKAFIEAMKNKKIECDKHTHQDSIEISKIQEIIVSKH